MFLNRLLAFTFTFAVTAAVAAPGFAQGSDAQIEERVIEDIFAPQQDEYVPATVENLSKLYWAIGKMDIDDPKLIDYYLLINECKLYLQYYNNDFEWSKIREATRQYILENLDEFPTRIEIMTPLRLGRYNMEKQVFEIAEKYKISGMRRLDFAMNVFGRKETCTKVGQIYEYPDNLIIILNRPLEMEQVPVKPELAQLYIEDARKQYDNLDLDYQMREYERTAFLRLKVRITQYKNTAHLSGGAIRAVVFGRLEGYEVYADPEKLKPLYIKDIQSRRFRRLRKATEDAPADAQAGQEADSEPQNESAQPVNAVNEVEMKNEAAN